LERLPNPDDYRKADFPIEPIFVRRWSPRAMSGEPITNQEMMTLFEAARWQGACRVATLRRGYMLRHARPGSEGAP
jgi:hypothetical protein